MFDTSLDHEKKFTGRFYLRILFIAREEYSVAMVAEVYQSELSPNQYHILRNPCGLSVFLSFLIWINGANVGFSLRAFLRPGLSRSLMCCTDLAVCL